MKIKNAARQMTTFLLVYTIFIQSAVFASPGYSPVGGGKFSPIENAASLVEGLKNGAVSVFGKSYNAAFSVSDSINGIAEFWRKAFSSDTGGQPATNLNEQDNNAQNFVAIMPDNPNGSSTYAAISRHRPSLNGGTIQGSLRVFSGESYTVNSQFHLTNDLFTVGVPSVTVNSGASHGGIISDGGNSSPSGYGITLNSGAVLPGKIHIRADAFALPSDIPSSVPNPSGTRYVNINSPSDVNSIGSWSTVRSLTVSPSNLTINVPPGNYDTFSMNGSNIKLVFSAGTYNFSGAISLNSGSRVESNGKVTINIGQGWNVNNGSYLLGANTSSADVKINVVGSSFTLDNGSEINALVRAVNANVNINNGIIRGQLIANYLNINNGQIIASTEAADTTPPTLTITSPANNSTTQATSVNVSGTAFDSSGISGVTVNNAAATYNASTGAWSFSNLNLNLGSNTITVKATDTAGNVSTQTITVIRQQPPDTTPPTVAITSPANNSIVPDAAITVSGTAADTGTGATGINRVVVNNRNAVYNSSTGQWTISGVQLNEGANTIQAVAYDNASPQNSAQVSIVVTRRTPDTQPPTISISSPANNSETYESNIAVNGTANDEGLNASGVQSVTVNGQSAAYNAATHQWSAANIPLAVGDNTITAIARDGATPPNQAQAVIHVIRKEIPPPTVSISSPANNSATTAANISVAGLATAFSAGNNQIAQVTVNGAAASYDGASGSWILTSLPLTLGANTITAKAKDSGGREATAQITVVRNPVNQPPVAVDDAYRINEANPDFNIKLPAKFSAKTFVGGSPFNSILSIAASPDDKLYVSDSSGAIIELNLSTKAASTVTTLPFARPRTMVIGNGNGIFGGDLIVSDHNSEPNSSCCNGQVLKINRTTGEVTVLSNGNPAFPPFGDPFGLAFGSGGGFAAGLYVMDFEGNSPNPPVLFRINNDGTRSTVLTNSSIWTTERTPAIIVFGGSGFGSDLYVADSGAAPPNIWRVNSQGSISSFIGGEPLRRPGEMKFGRGGLFGNDLYVLDNERKSIFKISADGTIAVFARDLPLPDESSATMDFTPDGQNLFIGINNKIIRISAASLVVAAPGVLSNDTDPENSPLTSTLVTGASSGAVTLNSDGSFEYTSGTNFSGTDSFTYRVSDGALNSNAATVNITNIVNQSPVINAGANQNISLPNAANLNGIVSDDNLPSNNLTVTWTKISGNGYVNFADPNAAQTTATFYATGTFVLRLTASDGELSISDDITINVFQPNQPPTVNAGQDQNITLPDQANLSGSATDDGLPSGSSLSVSWSKTSGPGTVVFATPNALTTTASFSQSGVYVLRLTASDSLLTAYDEITVTVSQPNQPPIVNAGEDKIVALPNKSFRFIQNNLEQFNQVAGSPSLGVDFDSIAAGTDITGQTYNGILFEKGNQPSPSAPLIIVRAADTFTPDGFNGVIDSATNKLFPASGENVLSPGGTELAPGPNGLKENDDIKLTFAEPVSAVGFDILFQEYDFYSAVSITVYDPQGAVLYQNGNLPVTTGAGGGAPGGREFFGFVSGRSNIKSIVIDEFDDNNQFPDSNIGLSSLRVQKVLPNTFVSLNGSVSDDGLPAPANLTSVWSKISGSGTATFSNTASPISTVTFSEAGTYVLRLTANDGALQSSDDVTIIAYENGQQPVNQPPNVNAGQDQTITFPNPANLSGYVTDDGLPTGGGVTVSWSKTSGPGNVSFVSANSASTGASFSQPGTYVLRLTATDTDKTAFDEISITVRDSSATNQPPQVFAGNDVSTNLNSPLTLNGTASDDGLPAGSALSLNWSKTSGPGAVTFSNPSALQTTATFSAQGIYVLRLTASDGQLSSSDDLVVTVNPAQPNQPPIVNAGSDKAIRLNGNLAINGSAEAETTGGGIPNWNVVSGSSWTRFQGGSGTTPVARFGDYVFSPGTASAAEIIQDIDVRAYGNKIDAGTQSFTLQVYLRSLIETTPDAGRILVEYRDRTNLNSIATLDTGEISSTADWHLTEDMRVPPTGTGFIRIHLIAVRKSGLSNDVFFDGVSFKADGGGAAVKLDGTASDDNLPTGNTLQTTWTKVSGSGNVSFSDVNSTGSAIYFDTAGTYVLRLTANDGALTSSDEVTVTVGAANQPPAANAGADAAINAFANLTLNGGAIDDGGNLHYLWSKVSGPGSVSINNARIANPTVSFPAAGTYVLRLTVEDGEFDAADDVTITVNPAPANQPPTVDAGPNRNIAFPNNTATLSGTATDDGQPNANLTINWSKTSGPGSVTFANPNTVQTAATFSAVGTYVLRLTVSDGQYIAYDEMSVTVSPQNLPPTVNVGADQTITISQTAVLEAQVSDDGLPAGGSFSANWTKVSGGGNVSFSNPTETSTFASFSQTGTYVLRLTVSDSEATASDEVTVTVIENIPPPTTEITITDGASITEPITVTGTISEGSWNLQYSLADTDDPNTRAWTTVATGTGAASGNLGRLDTTLMLNGLYDIRLTTTDQYGRTVSDTVSVSVENNLKVGHFTVSFEDMNVPVAGIPMQIVRTYDSRDKRKGDFGYGWTLGVKNIRVEKNKTLGLSWYQTRSNTFIPSYCIEATRPHIVTVTLPDGTVEKFEARTERQCQAAAPITETRLIFTPTAGTRGKLSIGGDNLFYVGGSVPGEVQFIAYDGTGIFDRTQFVYTAKDGTEFVISQGAGGLQSVKDTNGNTLTISASGITHSSGQSITFTRDNQGRITNITDPKGVSNVYAYNANGDLISYKDRENNTTAFTYETAIPHHLKSIVDPLNRTPIRNEYDASGRLLKHIDANGDEIVYMHNLAARSETVTDRLGNATNYEYDARGNVLIKRDALNNQTTYNYDANDNLLTETNALGKTTVYTYDQSDNRTSVTDALGNRTEMTYNAKGQVLTVKDARNNTTTNTYDTAGNLLTSSDAQGNVTSNTYSAYTGQLTTTKDALNNVTTFDYFGSYLKKQTDAQGNETTFGYDQNGNRNSQTVKRTNAQGQIETITTAFEYDNLNRLTKTTNADGSFTRTEYNALGQQKATIDQAGNRTEFEYDTLGRLIKTIYADGKFEESTFDAEGRRLTSKDRAGRTTSYEYDALGRLKKTTYSDGTSTRTDYDAIGRIISNTDAKGNTTTYEYDPNCGCSGRRSKIINALGQITTFTYDGNGNQISMTDARNNTTSYEFDALNRQTKVVYPDSTFSQATLDALGRRTSSKDQAGKITGYTYDSLGRLMKVTDALGQETKYGYNELGQQISQTDAGNNVTRYEYDQLGRRTKRILPLGQVETYNYNNLGNLQSKTDFNGKTTTFNYDSMRRLLSKVPDASLNQPTVSFTYNDLGQRAIMTDASGITTYDYDNRNRLTSKQTPFGTLSYTYDENGSIETLRSSNTSGISVDYEYDALNRLRSAKDNRLPNGANATIYTYNEVGSLSTVALPNGVATSYGYNSLNRLTNLNSVKNGNTIAGYTYTLGASGNRTQVVENNSRTVNYVYDDLYRLTQETIANSANNGQINYQYDAVGNRLQRASSVSQVSNQSSTFDANDRINSDTFDDNGNTKVGSGRQFNYDFENKLTSTSDGIIIVYDGDGNRVSKIAGGVRTNYLVDTNNLTGYAQVVEEIQNNLIVKIYTYGLDLISQRRTSGVSFYNYDGHGSVRNLTDNLGNVTDTYSYDAFGNLTERTGTTDNNYLYAGEQFDADLGFYYNRARYLNVETGRFISQDNLEGNQFEPKSLHKYLYAENDPANRVDPSGNSSIAEVSIAINVGSILNAINGILAVAAVAAVACAVEAGTTYALDVNPITPCGIKRHRETLFHYTDIIGALGIQATQTIFATPDKKFGGFTFPSGAYATDIKPNNSGYTQRSLSALFYGGNENVDVSYYVEIEKNDFTLLEYPGFPHQWIRYAPAGFPVPVKVVRFGQNSMIP